ncbi:hypothetical protein BsWGS_17170 [Bradybaena similaris]
MSDRESRRHNEYVLRRALPGDLLQFPRDLGHSHWGVYVGNEEVIHLAGDPGNRLSKASAAVRKENFWIVAGTSKTIINNLWDGRQKLLPAKEVVRRAEGQIGCKGYNLFSNNCEQFACWCRYNVKISSQLEALHSELSNTAVKVAEVLRDEASQEPDSEERARNRWRAIGKSVMLLGNQILKDVADDQLKGPSSK